MAVCFKEPHLVLHPLLIRNPVTGAPADEVLVFSFKLSRTKNMLTDDVFMDKLRNNVIQEEVDNVKRYF